MWRKWLHQLAADLPHSYECVHLPHFYVADLMLMKEQSCDLDFYFFYYLIMFVGLGSFLCGL